MMLHPFHTGSESTPSLLENIRFTQRMSSRGILPATSSRWRLSKPIRDLINCRRPPAFRTASRWSDSSPAIASGSNSKSISCVNYEHVLGALDLISSCSKLKSAPGESYRRYPASTTVSLTVDDLLELLRMREMSSLSEYYNLTVTAPVVCEPLVISPARPGKTLRNGG